jgi:DNA-binding winged helix-turn-helix (wHTH) protein/Flp pilus assembly protein TadD
MKSLPLYEFGSFQLDSAERVLFRDGKPVHLSLKAFSVLLMLVENAGHVVQKDDFMRQVWSDAFVEDSNLTQSIALSRRALGETNDSCSLIETVHRRGYRFIGSVTALSRVVVKKSVIHRDTLFRSDVRDSLGSRPKRAKHPAAGVTLRETQAAQEVEKRHTSNDETHHSYVRGRYYWSKYTVEGLMKGIDHFHNAIKMDSKYALAYVGLADCYYRLSNIHLNPAEAMPKAKMALMKALLIDDGLAEAHSLMGLITVFYEWNWPAGKIEFERAIELAPECALVHKRYGWALGLKGQFDGAVAEMERAVILAPSSSDLRVGLGIVLHLARLYDRAIIEAQQALDMNPEFYAAHALLGMAYTQQQRLAEAILELQQAASLADIPWTLGYLGYAYGVSGERQQAVDLLSELTERSKEAYVPPYNFALICAGVGDKEQALPWVQRTCEDRNELLGFVRVSPEFDELRSDRRFATLLNQTSLSIAA